MASITCPQFNELDHDIIKDFLECLQENVESIEACIEQLDQHSEPDLIHSLFRDVHSFKGNCRMVFLDPMVETVHHLEEIVDDMRHNERTYQPNYGEFFLTVIYRQRSLIVDLAEQGEIDSEEQDDILALIERLHQAHSPDDDGELRECLKILSSWESSITPIEPTVKTQADAPTSKAGQTAVSEDEDDDLNLFRSLARQTDSLEIYQDNRSEEILELCLETNAELGRPVCERQLAAAVYMHDLGMALIPAKILQKPARLNADEFEVIKNHVAAGGQLLQRIEGWSEAAKMVWQHHEKHDGSGYPKGISGDDIHAGARMIALADTFFAVTHARVDRSYKKTLFSAVSMINGESGRQFDPSFVDAFNATIRRLYVSGGEKKTS